MNVLNCQTILAPVLGSNLPLWSLANEFWYYLLCPAILITCSQKESWQRRAVAALALLLMVSLLAHNKSILLYGVIWAIGAWAHTWNGYLRLHPWWCAIALMGCLWWHARGDFVHWLAPFVAGPLSSLVHFIPDLFVAVTFCGLLLAVRSDPRSDQPLWGVNWHRRLADFSYSLYLGHYPFALLVLAMSVTWFGAGVCMQPYPLTFLFLATLLVLTYIYCFGLAWISERHTSKIRAWLLSHW